MKKFFILIFFFFCQTAFSQPLYQGPAAGSVSGGVTVSTDDFTDSFDPGFPPFRVMSKENAFVQEYLPMYMNKIIPAGPEGSNFVLDKNTYNQSMSPSVLLKDFRGISQTQYLPPDPSIAAGPTHVIGGVNSTFRIWDKNGNVIKTISASLWLSSLGLGVGGNVSDPKITYDHFAKRWIMTWITPPIGPFAYDVISVSDDSIPLGNWYNFALRTDLNGSTPTNIWRDYQGVGYDANALYITGNDFTLPTGGFQYCALRIINKSLLYSNTGGPVSWFDIWDIRDASTTGATIFGIRPTITYGTPGEFYLLCKGRFSSNSYINLYKLVNPLTSPSMTGTSIPVILYSAPPPSAQLNSAFTITSGGSADFRSEPVYRNGSLYAVHAVASNGGANSSFKFYKINPVTNTAVQDITFGASGFFYSYPAISVDKDDNVLVSYSRSANTQYIGAYYSSRTATDPPDYFSPSQPLKPGLGTYNNSGSSNRWGDYQGSWIDAADMNNFWIMTEYAELNNNWGTWVGNVRVAPYPQAQLVLSNDSLNFGDVETAIVSDTLSFTLLNYSSQQLNVTGLSNADSQFRLVNAPSTPFSLGFNDSIKIKAVFQPVQNGLQVDTLRIISNSSGSSVTAIRFYGNGYTINSAVAGIIYGAGGIQSGGNLFNINKQNGNASVIGPTNFTQVHGMTVRPNDHRLYGTITQAPQTNLIRIDAQSGAAYSYKKIPVANVRGITFETNDIIICAVSSGAVYKYNISTGDTSFVGNTGINNLYDVSINPVSGSLFGITLSGELVKINKSNAATVSVGNLNSGFITGISFDAAGKLYALSGIGTQQSNLLSVDTANASATLIGSTGFQGINNIAISPETVGIQNISSSVPGSYKLYQNYPNPFNPVTTIKFDVQEKAFVRLTVFDAAGREVLTVLNEEVPAGSYQYIWNASEFSSGIYFYRIQTPKFSQTLKMLLIK